MSASSKAPRGKPALYLTAASTSSMVASPFSTTLKASFIIAPSTLFTMNPRTSFRTTTGVFPSFLTSSTMASVVSSLVPSPLTTSTRVMRTGGLKKCIPMTLSGLSVWAAISVMLRLEVLLARMAWAGAASFSRLNMLFLSSIFSGTASTTRSASATAASRSTLVLILARAAFASSSRMVFFSANLPRLQLMLSMAFLRTSSLMSTRVTSKPARARSSPIPWPMSPAPRTVALSISLRRYLQNVMKKTFDYTGTNQ